MLVNKETGEEIARSPKGAGSKGIILPKDSEVLEKEPAPEQKPELKLEPSPPPPPPPETGKPTVDAGKAEPTALIEELEGEGEEEEKGGERAGKGVGVDSSGILTFEISLPADAFVLFNLAKTCGLEKDIEKPFEEWVWDCIARRFTKDYKMQLILAPIEEEE